MTPSMEEVPSVRQIRKIRAAATMAAKSQKMAQAAKETMERLDFHVDRLEAYFIAGFQLPDFPQVRMDDGGGANEAA